MAIFTPEIRDRLTRAIINDTTIEDADAVRLLFDVGNLPIGTDLNVEIPNGTDGTNPVERVALANDFYFG